MAPVHRKERANGSGEYTGRLIGYARVSTRGQDLESQLRDLERAGVDPGQIWSEKVSGVSRKRPQRDLALLDCRRGDTLVVSKLDRLGRSARELLVIVDDLEKRGVGFRTADNTFDTTKPGGKFLFHVLAAVAEFERAMIAERTSKGMAIVKARGKRLGKPLFFTAKRQAEFERRYRAGESVRQIVDSWDKTPTLIRVRYNKRQLERLRREKG